MRFLLAMAILILLTLSLRAPLSNNLIRSHSDYRRKLKRLRSALLPPKMSINYGTGRAQTRKA